MLLPNNQYYLIYLNLYLYLSGDGRFICSTLTPNFSKIHTLMEHHPEPSKVSERLRWL